MFASPPSPRADGCLRYLVPPLCPAPARLRRRADHANALLTNPAVTSMGAGGAPAPIGFYTSGSAGVAEYGYAPAGGPVSDAGYTGPNAMPTGFAQGAAAVAAAYSRRAE